MQIRQCVLTSMMISFALISISRAGDQSVIKGIVKWTANKRPQRKLIQTNADPNCALMRGGQTLLSERIIVNANSTVQNVFVYIKSGLPKDRKWDVPPGVKTLDQKGCRYEPHVFGIMAGQRLVIRNSDGTLHNINCNPKHNEGFNKAQPMKGLKYEHVFDNPEHMIQFKCNVHPWMIAHCAVMEHPFFAVTNDEGRFEITGLPPGEYILATWHEDKRLKPLETKVTLGPNETKDDIEFVYK